MKILALLVALVFAPLSIWLLVMSLEHMQDANASSQGFSMAAMTAFVAVACIKRVARRPPEPPVRNTTVR